MGKKEGKKDGRTLKKANPELEWVFGGILGKGSFGEVYAAQNSAGTIAAAKVCAIKCEGDYEDMKLEAEILTHSDHINVLKAMGAYFYESKICIILELCSGGALDDLLEKMDGFDENAIRCISYQTLSGLCYLHRNCIMHRDIKAGNIMLTENGCCKLADFGVSARLSTPTDRRNTFIGTPYWMAPEVILAESDPNYSYDVRADTWSYGITLLELAEMTPPNSSYTPMQVFLCVVRKDPPTLKEPSRWSEDFRKFVEAILIKDPRRRPTTEKLLTMPFVSTPEAKSYDPLIEVYKISKALDLATEEEVSEIAEDLKSNNEIDIDIDAGISINTPSNSGSIEKEIVNEFSNVSISQSPKAVYKKTTKTIRVEVGGKTHTKTVVKIVDQNNKGLRERDKSYREQITKEMRVAKMQEQRDCKKLVQQQEAARNELANRHKIEFDNHMEKYRTESEAATRNNQREIEKRNAYYRSEQEKCFKRLKAQNEKERKLYQAARKNNSKNSKKYDTKYQNPNYITQLQTQTYIEWTDYLKSQSQDLVAFSASLVVDKHEALLNMLSSIILMRLSQALEMAQVHRNQVVAMLEFILCQKKKADMKELAILHKSMTAKKEEMKRVHLLELRETPKLQRNRFKKELEAYKKEIRSRKEKNEKELLQKKYDELMEVMSAEVEEIKAKQAKALTQLEENIEMQFKDLKEYQHDKSKTTHLFYQQVLHKRSQDDESNFKHVLLQMSELRMAREKEKDIEMEASSHVGLEVFASIGSDSF